MTDKDIEDIENIEKQLAQKEKQEWKKKATYAAIAVFIIASILTIMTATKCVEQEYRWNYTIPQQCNGSASVNAANTSYTRNTPLILNDSEGCPVFIQIPTNADLYTIKAPFNPNTRILQLHYQTICDGK